MELFVPYQGREIQEKRQDNLEDFAAKVYTTFFVQPKIYNIFDYL
jgi:hypothetical protein